MGFQTSKSTNTSFSTLPSRKASVASGVSEANFSSLNAEISQTTNSPSTKNDSTPTRSTPRQDSETSRSDDANKVALLSPKHSKVDGSTKTEPAKKRSVSGKSMRKADAKSDDDKEISPPNDQKHCREALRPAEPKINIEDQKEWPALGPAKSPVSSIADGKRPAPPVPITYDGKRPPVMTSLNERIASVNVQKPTKHIVPAVPRSFMPRSQP